MCAALASRRQHCLDSKVVATAHARNGAMLDETDSRDAGANFARRNDAGYF
jgi:hypothetical protein